MALEAVIYQKDSFIYACKDYNYDVGLGAYAFGLPPLDQDHKPNIETIAVNGDLWDSPPSSVAQNAISSPEIYDHPLAAAEVAPPQLAASRRKRRRTKSLKNKEEMESQRMTHIAVERNRRRQMNDYLAVLRSLMPPSYAQRGDQASIVGGAINFVKELEQLLQFLEAHKSTNNQEDQLDAACAFSKFFTFPQYSTRPAGNGNGGGGGAVVEAAEKQSRVADIEVAMVESHANIKILAKRRPKQLLKMVSGLQSLCLTVLHLNITTVDQSVLYAFSVKVEDDCQLSTVNEIATALHEMVAMIEEEESRRS